MPRRTALAILAGWVATLVVTAVVTLPERCPTITSAEARAAAEEAVDWFERNQLPDGRWVYAYDRSSGEAELVPHLVRHAGVTMSLYQAHAAGIEGALELADRGTDWALAQAVDAADGITLALGSRAPTGASALLAAGLALREEAVGDGRYVEDARALGRFLVATIEDDGAVLAEWDVEAGTPVPDLYSLFFTGEALWALVLLDRIEPADGFADPARSVLGYLATDRDEAEELFPPVSDHWGAYALGDLGADLAARGERLDEIEVDWARRLAGIFGIQIRYESQRTGSGLNLLLRGDTALGAGVGTLGEGLAPLWELASVDDRLAGDRAVIAERLRCVVGVLHDRQVTEDEAAEAPDPDLARGAWFTGDRTQKDDQQHALSALLLAEGALAEAEADPPGRVSGHGDAGPVSLAWSVVVLVAAANPVRARRSFSGVSARSLWFAAAGVGGVLSVAALAGSTLADLLGVSPPTLVLAAALVVLATGALDLARGPARPVPVEGEAAPSVAALGLRLGRPALVLAAAALGAHLGPVPGVAIGAVTAALLGAAATGAVPVLPTADRVAAALGRAVGALALAGGLTLVVLGSLSP